VEAVIYKFYKHNHTQALAIPKLQLQLSNSPATLAMKVTVFPSHENAGI
jgi:hypothetical protein